MRPEVEIRRLSIEDLTDDALASYERLQETTRIRTLVDGEFAETALTYVEDWDSEKKRQIMGELRECLAEGGVVLGALDGSSILAFANVLASRFGSKQQYVEMPYCHVSNQLRGAGIGRKLFQLATSEARSLGAPFLYVETNPSIETQAFYDAMGCVPATDPRPLKDGSDEIQFEYPLI